MSTAAGRPRSFEPRRVLDDALELFWRNGYRATTTRELAAELGVSQSSLYNTFGSKRGLLMAVLDTYERRITTELVEPLEGADSGIDAIVGFFDRLAGWVTGDGRRGCMIINLMAEDAGGDAEITERTRAYRRRVRAALRDALRRDGVADARARADVLYAMVLGLNIAARGGAATSEVWRLVASARTVLQRWQAGHDGPS